MQNQCLVLEESATGNFFNRTPKDSSVSNDISNLQQHTIALSSTMAELREETRFLQKQLESIKMLLKKKDRASIETDLKIDMALEEIDAKTHQNEQQIDAIKDVLFEFMQNIVTPQGSVE